jgi:hypothetical protein
VVFTADGTLQGFLQCQRACSWPSWKAGLFNQHPDKRRVLKLLRAKFELLLR